MIYKKKLVKEYSPLSPPNPFPPLLNKPVAAAKLWPHCFQVYHVVSTATMPVPSSSNSVNCRRQRRKPAHLVSKSRQCQVDTRASRGSGGERERDGGGRVR